jgi:hypothetical protein
MVVVYDMRLLHLRLKDCGRPAREIRKESVDRRPVRKGKMSSSSSAAAAAVVVKEHAPTSVRLLCVYACMHTWMHAYMDGWMDGWLDRWMSYCGVFDCVVALIDGWIGR